jgi:hypothetical protein
VDALLETFEVGILAFSCHTRFLLSPLFTFVMNSEQKTYENTIFSQISPSMPIRLLRIYLILLLWVL